MFVTRNMCIFKSLIKLINSDNLYLLVAIIIYITYNLYLETQNYQNNWMC